MSVPSLAFVSIGLSDRTIPFGMLCTGGVDTFGHETAVVGASRSFSSSSTDALHFFAAADRLHRDIEKPGALSDVSKGALRILTGLMFQSCAIHHT